MATINGTTIEFEDISIDSDVDLAPYNILGSNENQLAENGMSGLRISLSARALSSTDYDNAMAAIMGQGQKELVITSGWTYQVFTDRKSLDHGMDNKNLYRFSVDFLTVDPYVYTTTLTTRSKSITTNPQQWSADDSANDIDTSGNVAAAPDIKVTGGAATANYDRIHSTHEEVNNTATSSTPSGTYVLLRTTSYEGRDGQKINLTEVGAKNNNTNGQYKITYQFNSGSETTIVTDQASTNNTWVYHSTDVTGIDSDGLDVRYYLKQVTGGDEPKFEGTSEDFNRMKREVTDSVDVFNTADTGTVNNVCNLLFEGMISRINRGGTGHVDYTEDMSSSTQFLDTSYDHAEGSLTYDAVNDEIDISDDGYLDYKFDVKYPVTGTPTLTANINITAGTPTIQVAKDDGNGEPDTWYDIDTAIVDDVETTYKLKSGNDIIFDGETVVFVRIDCVKAAAATLSIKSLDFDFDIVTIDAQMPVINTGAANTFQCDQGTNSNDTCTVALIYEDRKWA